MIIIMIIVWPRARAGTKTVYSECVCVCDWTKGRNRSRTLRECVCVTEPKAGNGAVDSESVCVCVCVCVCEWLNRRLEIETWILHWEQHCITPSSGCFLLVGFIVMYFVCFHSVFFFFEHHKPCRSRAHYWDFDGYSLPFCCSCCCCCRCCCRCCCTCAIPCDQIKKWNLWIKNLECVECLFFFCVESLPLNRFWVVAGRWVRGGCVCVTEGWEQRVGEQLRWVQVLWEKELFSFHVVWNGALDSKTMCEWMNWEQSRSRFMLSGAEL